MIKYFNQRRFKKRSLDWWFLTILCLAAFLYGWQIWQAGEANSFYTAAIVSMTKSWHNFWYASFDPAGFITVDKPPVALWFMVICVKIFGLHGWSIVLSSVLFGIGSVALIYHMVKPYFGRLAANLSSLLMTLTPIVVANSRTNNMDATLVFFLLLAGWVLQKAVVRHRASLVMLSFALIGISFNIKMLQAFMVLPGMYLFYWLTQTEGWRRKSWVTLGATGALLVFTLAWPLAVDSTSKSSRPYIGSSSTNSVLNLAFGYNGSQRLLGQSTGIGGRFSGMGNTKKKASATPPNSNKQKGKMGNPPSQKGNQPGGTPGGNQNKKNNAMAGGGIFNIGTAGPFRLFQSALGEQIGWYLPLAIVGFISAYLLAAERKLKWWQMNRRRQQLLYWAGWLVPVAGFFSIASFFHPYYMIMLAPPIAVLAGVGIAELFKASREHRLTKSLKVIVTLGYLTTLGLQAWYVSSYYPWLSAVIVIAGLMVLAGIYFHKENRQKFLATGLIIVLLAPGFWSLTPTIAAESAAVPTSGPSLLSGGNNNVLGDSKVNTKLLKYLEKHQGKATYLFATMDSNSVAPYIIKSGKAVMTIGGYNGTDNAISLKQFKKLVKAGKVKYFYLSGKTQANNAIVKWVKKYGKKVASSKYQSSQSKASSSKNSPSGMNSPTGTSKKMGTPPGGTKPTGKKPSGNQKRSQVMKPSTTKTNHQPGNMNSGTLYRLS